jgi:DHA1 family bicyclomycin/chloramphenicol resistance-like MFS transporter
MRLSREWERTSIITGCVVVIVLSGILVLLFGKLGPWAFIMALIPGSIALSCLRPPVTYLLLDQHEGDAGSASALMGASHMVMGSVGMVIVSFPFGGRVELIGALNVFFGLLVGGLWLGIGQPLVRSARKA